MKDAPILSLREITKSYRTGEIEFQALKGVSLDKTEVIYLDMQNLD